MELKASEFRRFPWLLLFFVVGGLVVLNLMNNFWICNSSSISWWGEQFPKSESEIRHCALHMTSITWKYPDQVNGYFITRRGIWNFPVKSMALYRKNGLGVSFWSQPILKPPIFHGEFFWPFSILPRFSSYSPGATSQSCRDGGFRSGLSKAANEVGVFLEELRICGLSRWQQKITKPAWKKRVAHFFKSNFKHQKHLEQVAWKKMGCHDMFSRVLFFHSKGSRPS